MERPETPVVIANYELLMRDRELVNDEERHFDLVVLDELTYLPALSFLPVEKIVETLKAKPERLSIIVTGRNAPQELVELADTVSDITVVKHAYQQGIKAQKGVEF